MGTDIHAGIEYMQPGVGWKALFFPNKYPSKDEPKLTPCLDLDRNYDLFAILADVRNGHGFAGVKTGEGFVPMSSQRGIPTDVSSNILDHVLSNEHSATWVLLTEILDYDWGRTAQRCGVVGAVEFEHWDRMKEWEPTPRSYSGGVAGPKVQIVSNIAMRQHVKETLAGVADRDDALKKLSPDLYTRVTWIVTYSEAALQVWTKILPHMLPLGKEHGYNNVRLVMDFDS